MAAVIAMGGLAAARERCAEELSQRMAAEPSFLDAMCLERPTCARVRQVDRAALFARLPEKKTAAPAAVTVAVEVEKPAATAEKKKRTNRRRSKRVGAVQAKARSENLGELLMLGGVTDPGVIALIAEFADGIMVPEHESMQRALAMGSKAIEVTGDVRVNGGLKVTSPTALTGYAEKQPTLETNCIVNETEEVLVVRDLVVKGENQYLKVSGAVEFHNCSFPDTDVHVTAMPAAKAAPEVKFFGCNFNGTMSFKRSQCLQVTAGTASLEKCRVVNLISGSIARGGNWSATADCRVFPRADVMFA
eukprot:CAMPEP_0204493594 /NCGR_PEP_ID=MMETSP0471-20130131/82438_1 /ASSEMBLY_ACC=CAM_ASM_000602 /TAXON_ID=2969 /ORGANISM="Oxyrrhis marina" /LENGTH=304 /DNA_ID=CAMNT_0051497733 /DNA_START=46 /DNA_END=960 /DNA_ORIENTATION=-